MPAHVFRIIRWIGIVLGGLVVLVALGLAGVYVIGGVRLNRVYPVPIGAVAIPTDAASIARGQHLVQAVGHCTDCHGPDLGGKPLVDDPLVGTLYSANLTRGQGGAGTTLTDADFVRAIRYGVRPDGKPLLIMPAEAFYYFSDADLGDIIAYLKSVPPVDQATPVTRIGVLGRVGLLTGQLLPPAAEAIDFAGPRPSVPSTGTSAEYGAYLVNAAGCRGCHGPSLSGGPVPGQPASAPPAANLTPAGELTGWTATDFITTLRTGVTPSGHHLQPLMLWKYYGQMSDDELTAVWLYLKTLPPKATGSP